MVMIKAENLSKKYILSHKNQNTGSNMREAVLEQFKETGKRLLNSFAFSRQAFDDPSSEEFWAINNISFDIMRGDRVGVIGRNGAGKSTLLKILSRITSPTRGRVTLNGRVASLLEIGTGFHSELTGRENIFLNGAILGMNRTEIKRKFDEIVDFSEVEKFLDTPVKRYSSGMYMRLAFAIAAHLEPEILVVDEVLAVGDARFQKKCLGKMEDVSNKDGRTVLFVSHNMTAISSLCNKVIVLENGETKYDGTTQAGIDYYMNKLELTSSKINYFDRKNHDGELIFSWFHNVSLLTSESQPITEIRIGDAVKVCLDFELFENIPNLEIGFCIHDLMGQRYSHFFADWEGLYPFYERGRHNLECTVPELLLLPGIYEISPWIKRRGGAQDDGIHSACRFSVIGDDINGHQPDFERYPNLGMYIKSQWIKKV